MDSMSTKRLYKALTDIGVPLVHDKSVFAHRGNVICLIEGLFQPNQPFKRMYKSKCRYAASGDISAYDSVSYMLDFVQTSAVVNAASCYVGDLYVDDFNLALQPHKIFGGNITCAFFNLRQYQMHAFLIESFAHTGHGESIHIRTCVKCR